MHSYVPYSDNALENMACGRRSANYTTEAFGFDTGVRDVELVGPLELKLAGNEDGGLVELQLPSVSGLTLTWRCFRFCLRS
jgi:hypothetical protein